MELSLKMSKPCCMEFIDGMNGNKGFYTNPLNKAWHTTIVEPDELLTLYPDDVTCTQTMTQLFCFDYWVSCCESPECCSTKTQTSQSLGHLWHLYTFVLQMKLKKILKVNLNGV
jgi:hypothetical protein